MSLICLGTVALDNIKTPSGIRKCLLGGSAAHFSMSARLFAKVCIAGVIGEDFPGRYINLLKSRGIDLSSVVLNEGKTFQWEGEYRVDDFNSAITLATELGVLAKYKPVVSKEQENIPNIFLANLDPYNQMRFFKLMKNPKFVGLDSMNLWISEHKSALIKVMRKVDLFVANDGESRMLTGEKNFIKAAKALRKYGPKLIIIKKGENGVLFYSDKFMFSFPAFPIEKVVDPTGAGDTFAGGIMGYLSKIKKINEKTLREAVLYAIVCSSFNVEGFGMTKTSSLALKDVNNRKKKLIKFINPINR